MWNPLITRIRRTCTFCGHTLRIPRRRILRLQRSFDVKKGQPCIWECHDCHACPPSLSLRRGGREGVVIPGLYKNIHGEIVKIDPKTLDPNTEVIRF